jgi:protein disulfide-isomerase A1
MAGKVLVGKVDATVEGELAKRYKISGFPTIKLFKQGSEAGAYQGEKTELSLVEWVDTQTNNELNLAGNVIQLIDTCDDLTVRDTETKEQVRYVGFFDTNSSAGFAMLEAAALELRKNRVAFNVFVVLQDTASRCQQEADCTGGACWMAGAPKLQQPALIVSSQFLESVEKMTLRDQIEIKGLKAWMIEKSVPAVGDIDDDSSRKYFERQLPVFVAFMDPYADNSELKAQLGQLASKFTGKFSFVTGDGIKYRQIVSAMGMSTAVLPQIAIDAIHLEERPTFPYHRGRRTAVGQPITDTSLSEFAQDFLDGKLEQVEKQQREEAQEPEGSDVVELDDDQFKSLKSSHEWLLVLFYAPWSSESLDLMSSFRALASEYGMRDIAFGKNDVTSPSEMNRDYSPNVPAVMLFQNGEPVAEQMAGTANAATIAAYVQKQLADAATELTSAAGAKEFMEQDGAKVFCVLPERSSAAARQAVNSVLKTERGHFAYGLAPLQAAPTALQQVGVWVQLSGGKTQLVLPGGEFTANELSKQLQKLRVPTVLDFGPESGPILSRFEEVPIVMVLLPSHDWQHNQKIVAEAGAASRFAGRIVFLTINTAQMPQVADALKISNDPNDLPAVRVDGRQNKDRPGMFAPDEDFKLSVEGLQQLADAYLNNQPLEKVRKSSAEPDDDAKIVNGVNVLVGSTFDQEVLYSDHAAFVYFYAPWCQYCTRFTPIFEAFTSQAKAEHVKMYKFDATENDTPEFLKVEGFPTVYLFKQGNKFKPLMYDGQPNINGLRAFWEEELPHNELAADMRIDDEL